MNIRPSFILVLGILCYVKFVDSQIAPNPAVSAGLPPNLIECYNDSYITTPDNLLPMTLSTFLALVRKAESDPTIGQTDFRTMTSALLHRFRFDGLMLNPDIQASPGVIPFSAKGNEFSTYRLIMDYIIPDPNIYFNNYTFTRIERCTLHRMLSLSVDPWMRQDNDAICSNLMNDNYIGKLNLRIPRDVSKLNDVEVFDATQKSDGEESNNFMYNSNLNNYQTPRSNCPIENGVIYTPSGSLNPGLVLAGIAAGSSAQEYVDPSIMMLVQPRPGAGRPPLRQQPLGPQPNPRDPYFNRNRNTFLQQSSPGQGYPGGSNYPGGGGSNYPGGGGSNYPGGGGSNYPGVGGSNYPGGGSNYPGGGYPGGGGGYPGGSNYPGGSGGYPGAGGNYPRGGSNSIKKGWAATMAGILAQFALLQGPTGQMDNIIGVKGGWNDSISTKYYFLQDPTPDNLPNTRIRGALDGLIMAKSIQKWSGQAGNSNNFKLSQLLTMYYSPIGVFDPSAVACNRVQRVANVMPQADTADQVNNFANVLINHLPSAATINPQNIWSYSNQAANDVVNIANQLGSGTCGQNGQNNNNGQPGVPQGNQPRAYPTADIYLVVDLSYSYQGMKNIIQYIMESTNVNPYRSNITVLTAKSCPVLNSTLILGAQNTLDAQVSFTNYSSCIAGFDFLFSLVQIKSLMQNKLSYDYQLGLNPPYNNDIPRVVVFIPSQGVSIDSNTANLALNKFQDFQTSIPDTKFLYLTSGPTDRWNQFSNGTHPDIFALSREGQGFRLGINKLVQRISEIQRRITNPTCGAHWNRGYTYNQMTLTENLLYNEIQYFRVHPNYFISSSSGSIIVQPTQGTVQVCTSRTNPWPNRNTSSSGGATCQSVSGGSSYTVINLSSSLCSSSYATTCNPIYFSVQSTQATQQSNPSTCNDQTCEFPNMINYKITHSGLTCYSSALSILASPMLILLMLAAYFVNT